LIVVKSVAKSLLILIRSGDIVFEGGFYPDTNDVSSTSSRSKQTAAKPRKQTGLPSKRE
jgi:hypothetical protein